MNGDDPELSETAAPLDYRDPRDDRRHTARRAGSAVAMAFVSALGVFFIFFVFIMAGIQRGPDAWHGPAITAVVVIGILAFIALGAYRLGNKAVGLGFLIGIGVGLLVEGVCFVAASR